MGKIRVRKETGKLQFDFFYKGIRCREQTLLDDSPANRERLQVFMEKIDREIKQGTFEYEKYFPSWALEEDHPFVAAGQDVVKALWNRSQPAGKWDFSTNGNYWRGKAGIPCIGFGPGDEVYAHAVNEHVPLSEVVEATKFYALLPSMLKNRS